MTGVRRLGCQNLNLLRGRYWGIFACSRGSRDRVQRGQYNSDLGPIFPSTARASYNPRQKSWHACTFCSIWFIVMKSSLPVYNTVRGGKGFPKIACQRIFLDQGLPKTYVVDCRLVEALTLPDNWLASVTKRNQISVTLSGVCHRVPSSDVILISLYHFITNSIG